MSNLIWYETAMTSNIDPFPLVASASSENGNRMAWRAFQDFNSLTSTDDVWLTSTGNVTGHITINYGVSRIVNKVKIKSRGGSSGDKPTHFKIYGSNDGSTYYELSDIIDNTWTTSGIQEKSYSFKNSNSYTHYRLEILQNNGHSVSSIGRLLYGLEQDHRITLKNPSTNQYYSLADKTLIPLLDVSDKNMILHGIEAGKEIILDEAFDKINYPIENVESNKNSDGLLVLDLTNKPLSIKL